MRNNMNTKEKTYVTASELAETLDISMGKLQDGGLSVQERT